MSNNLDKDFFLPSQFEKIPDSPEHYRFKSGLVFSYFRGDALIAQVDMSDVAINEEVIREAGEEQILIQMRRDACLIADTHCDGKIQVGDREMINDEESCVFTQKDIEKIMLEHMKNQTKTISTNLEQVESTEETTDESKK